MDRVKRVGASSLAAALRKRQQEKGNTSEGIKATYLLADYIKWLETPWYKRWWNILRSWLTGGLA